MQYTTQALFNVTRGHFDGFTAPALLKSSAYQVWLEADEPQEAVDGLYVLLNADDRPNGRTERSVSVGDVVLVSDGAQTTAWVIDRWRTRRATPDEIASSPRLLERMAA